MKNKLIFTTLFYIIGVIIAYTEIITLKTLLIFFLLISLIVILSFNNREKSKYYLIIICLSIIIGFLIAKNNLNIILDDYYENVVTLEGKIVDKELDDKSFTVKVKK